MQKPPNGCPVEADAELLGDLCVDDCDREGGVVSALLVDESMDELFDVESEFRVSDSESAAAVGR